MLKVFVIPTWHPTPTKPLWANWVLPHISLLRENGVEAYTLQLGLDDEQIPEGTDPWRQPIRLLDPCHLYVPVPEARKPYQRTRYFYAKWLANYTVRLGEVYQRAVEQWGEPDILHAHVSLPAGFITAQLGQEFNIPVIVQEHNSGFESDSRFFWRMGTFIRKMGRQIQGFYAVSPGYAERVEKTGLLNVSGVLPNPIDTDLFSPVEQINNIGSFRIVTAGNLGWVKGTDMLFEALYQLMDRLNWRLIVFGCTQKKDKYMRWLNIDEFSERVTLPGKVSQTDLVSVYSNSDLYVVSSRHETANVSMLQAMACGVPVVTTSCGGPETLIDDTVGIAVAPGNPQALAKGIMQVAHAPQRYNREKLRQFVLDHYSKPVVADVVKEAYVNAIAQKAR
jgi:glycosyltransferase involved in cell wall biosynthesis